MRAVLDANVLVSALLSRTGAPARLLELWLEGAFELVLSPHLLEETRRTLVSPKLGGRVRPAEAERFLELLTAQAHVAPDPTTTPPLRSADPQDDYLLSLAAAEDARLVSGDRHLLDLADDAPVLTPRAFLDLIS